MLLNYDTLSLPVTDADVKRYAAKQIAWITPKTVALSFIVLACIMVLPAVVGHSNAGTLFDSSGILQVLMMLGITGALVFTAVIVTRLGAKQTARLQRFAEANNAVLISNADPGGMTGLIFDNGHSQKIDSAYAFNNGLELGNYSYTTGSGKNQTTHMYGYARVSLGRNLPNMVLDARSNNFLGSNLPDSFDASQRLSLEGDFDKYFDLYVPTDYQRDALYIFTPDVMQALVDHGKDFDIEVVGNELYIYSKKTIGMTSQISLQSWVSIVDAISSELKDQSKRYVDERLFASHRAAPEMPEVASGGQRLKHSRNYLVIVLFVVFVIVVFLPGLLPIEVGQTVAFYGWWTLLIILAVAVLNKLTYMSGRRRK